MRTEVNEEVGYEDDPEWCSLVNFRRVMASTENRDRRQQVIGLIPPVATGRCYPVKFHLRTNVELVILRHTKYRI